jgi:hypothetical protein
LKLLLSGKSYISFRENSLSRFSMQIFLHHVCETVKQLDGSLAQQIFGNKSRLAAE